VSKPKKMTFKAQMKALGACSTGMQWAGRHGLSWVWRECRRGDWMLWLAARADIDRKLIVSAVCGCARLALLYVPAGEDRPIRSIETAEAWVRGEVDISVVRTAAAAYASAYAASAYAAAYAADAYAAAYAAAAYAADAAYSDAAAAAAYAASAAASAAYASAAAAADAAYADAAYAAYADASAAAYAAAAYAADAAYAAAADAAYAERARVLGECADIVRSYISEAMVRDGLAKRFGAKKLGRCLARETR
jgi:hypothetical protein